MSMTSTVVENPKVVSRNEWTEARKRLLAKEKALTRESDALAAERRQLPWVLIDQAYVFEGSDGKESLADLFTGRTQLFIYHFMFGPDWEEGCPTCSAVADHLDRAVIHLAQRQVTAVVVSRAPYEKIKAFQQRMGWRFKWVSSFGTDFNRDFGVSFTQEELESRKPLYNYGSIIPYSDEVHGLSVFYRDEAGQVFQTYGSYGRGAEMLMVPYFILDRVPRGRDEATLPYPMAWLRHHDRYGVES